MNARKNKKWIEDAPAILTVRNGNQSNKKRKRDEAPLDDKRQEFLDVMQGRDDGVRKKRVVERQDEETVVDQALAKARTTEVESDDEYVELPPRAATHPPTKTKLETAGEDIIPSPTIPDPQQVKKVTKLEPEPVQGDATNDDWLRSHTTRFLDLVDVEDLPAPPSQAPISTEEKSEEPEGTSFGPPEIHEEDTTRPKVEEGPVEGKPIDPLESVRRSRRLFVRNLPYTTSHDELAEFFGLFGPVDEVSLQFPCQSRRLIPGL